MIFTFYSFKGGVGRSMAMATVGYLLAQRGLKVLVIDFDLEAPGLEHYFFDEPEQLARVRGNQGLLDLVLAYKRALTSEAEFQRAAFKDWPAFVVEAIPRTPAGGSVDLMPSGRRYPEDRYSEYALAVRGFDWQDFFHNWRGDGFFEWLRRELTHASRGYDAVLVDSRTGVTEMGGVCAYQLADVAVLLCAPNHQNLDGTRAVVTDFRSDAVVALRGGRPLEILVVPARVEQSDTVKRDRFFEDFERLFGPDGFPKALAEAGLDYRRLAVPYRAELAIIERLVDETAPGQGGALTADSKGRASFETLADALTLLSEGERWAPLKQQASARLAGGTIGTTFADSIADVSQRSAGYDAFISYATADRDAIVQLEKELAARQLNVWLDVQAIEPGDDWQDRVNIALQYSQALIVGIGLAAPGQVHWKILKEITARRKPIVPVLLPGCDDPTAALERHGLGDVQAIDLRDGLTPAGVDAISDALRRDRRLAVEAATPGAGAPPFPGAAPFSEENAAAFVGRGADVDRVIAAFSDHDVVLLEGAAGVGKTSLVQAGVLPRVRRADGAFGLVDAERVWTVVTIDAAAPDGTDSLAHFASSGPDAPALCVIDGIDSFPLNGQQTVRDTRVADVTRALAQAGPRRRFLLIWRGTLSDQERALAMAAWLTPTGRLAIPLSIDPLPAGSLRGAIEQPAVAAGHLFEPGLVDRLLQDAGAQSGAIGQIQIALADIWAGRRRGWLTNKSYEVGGAIAGRFETRLERCLRECQAVLGDAPATLLKNLVTLDAQVSASPVAREWSALASIPAIADPDAIGVCHALVRARLIDLWRDPQNRLMCGLAQPVPGPTIERLVHAEADFLLWRQRFATYVHQFVESNRSPSAAIADVALGEAEHWLSQKAGQLSGDERALIEQSKQAKRDREAREHARQRAEKELLTAERDAAERERQRAEAARRRANARARWLAVAALFVVGLAGYSLHLYRQSVHQQRQIELQAMLERARRLGAADPTAGAAALAYALSTHESAHDPEMRGAVLRAVFSLPDQPLARVRIDHAGPIRGSFFGPNDDSIVTFSDTVTNGGLRSWSLDGKPRRGLPGSALVKAGLSADRRQILALRADGHLQTLDADGRVLQELPQVGQDVTWAEFSRDSKRLVMTSSSGASQVRDLTGKVLAEFEPAKLVLSPDGTFVVTISANDVRLWNVDARRPTLLSRSSEGTPTKIRDATFSDDGRRLATTSTDGIVEIWNVGGRARTTIRAHAAAINLVTFSPDGRLLATASDDGTAIVWDATTGIAKSVMAGHLSGVQMVVFSHDGRKIVTASADGTARMWDVDGKLLDRFSGSDHVQYAAFDASDRWLLTWSSSGAVRLWDPSTRIPSLLAGHEGAVESAAFSPDSTLVVTSSEHRTANVWNLDTGSRMALTGHEDAIVHAEFSPDGRKVLTASSDKTTRIWALENAATPVVLQDDAQVAHASFSPDGTAVVTVPFNEPPGIWSSSGQLLKRLVGHSDWVSFAAFSPDGQQLVTASADRKARIWDRTGRGLAELSGHDGPVVRAVFAPDGRSILTASNDSTARLFDLSGRATQVFTGHKESVTDAEFSPDGRLVITASADSTSRVWDRQGRTLAELRGHTGRLNRAGFSPDGQIIATAAVDEVPRIWNVRGQLLAELHGHTGEIRQAAFSPNGQLLVTASADASARVWPITSAAYLRRVSKLGVPCLTVSELQELLLIESNEAADRAKKCRQDRGLE